MNKGIAFFDFDGTVTKTDSLLEMGKFLHGEMGLYIRLISCLPTITGFKLEIFDRQRSKETVMKAFFGGLPLLDFTYRCHAFSETVIPRMIRPEALDRIKWHQKCGHRVVLVSASPENWLKGWCHGFGIECIATILEICDERVTGRIQGKNCHGQEKVRRIKEKYDLEGFEVIHAYGDSQSDMPMLGIAKHPHYRPFR